MKIKKIVQGRVIELVIEKIKDYPRYTLYWVCMNGKKLYRQCFTKFQIKEIVKNGRMILEEEIE